MTMEVHDHQRATLKQTVGWAQEVEQRLADIRREYTGQVHFRPSSRGVTMVGLLPQRPQRGKGGFRNLVRLASNFSETFKRHCVECSQGRPTSEKQLQSWIVAEAYRNRRHLMHLKSESEPGPKFITDELALPVPNNKRIVCDLLALRGSQPVVIELKTSRAMTRLVALVTDYADLVDRHRDLFEQLYTVILGREVRFSRPCARWIVWPMLGPQRDPREDELQRLGIRVIGYTQADDGYRFRMGSAVD